MKLTQAAALAVGCGLASAATASLTSLSRRWDYDLCLNDCSLNGVPIPDQDNFQLPLENNWSEQCPPTFIGNWDAPTAVSKVCLGFSGPFVVFNFAPFPGYVTKTAKVTWKLMGNMLDQSGWSSPPPTATVDCQPAAAGDGFVCKVPFSDILQKPSSTSIKDLLAGMCPNGDREGLGLYLAFSGTVSAPGSAVEIPFKQQYPCKAGARDTNRQCTAWDTNYDYFSISYRCTKCTAAANLDLTSDNNNCGACGHSCASGTTCQSGACAPQNGTTTCSSYSASCFDVVHGVLASNSIASPQLVDYRIQSAIMGITSPSDFVAALGADPCHIFTDPTEHDSCVQLLANSQFIAQLTDITKGVLSAFQTCASDFATGGADYQVVINEPANATCPTGHTTARSLHEKRTPFGVEEVYDLLTRSVLEGTELKGPPKLASDLSRLTRKQLSTCAHTGECFQRCPDCRDQQTYCGSQATIITTAVCGSLAALVNAGVAVLAAGACGSVCAPLGPGAVACAAFCARAAGGLSAVAVVGACAELRAAICDPLTQRCANCNSANSGICNAGSTQCCPGETGTQCGAGCCCCPRHRDGFIQAANARARQTDAEAPPEPEPTLAAAEQYEDSTTDEFVDCEDYATQAVGTEDDAAPGDVDEESVLPYLEDEEPSQESTSLGAEPAMSFATSFTSSFTAQSQTRSKRNRDSPPSKSRPREHDSAKKRKRRTTPRRAAGSSAQGSTSSGSTIPPPASADEYWS